MSEVLNQSLWITLVSMGLVFAALILLAGLMSMMTRIFRDRKALTPNPSPDYGRGEESDKKARAAALAVAVALAEQAQSTARPLTPSQPAIIGAWQLGMRTRQMAQKGEMKRRGKE
jgi:Na+-transporting methylmalonyl-CoA/oxaloacetate decarboxylase gamma subunit